MQKLKILYEIKYFNKKNKLSMEEIFNNIKQKLKILLLLKLLEF